MRYDVDGDNFDIIPNDALGVMSYVGQSPLNFRYSSDIGYHVYEILDKSATSMIIGTTTPKGYGRQQYLGGIVSADREIVFWRAEPH